MIFLNYMLELHSHRIKLFTFIQIYPLLSPLYFRFTSNLFFYLSTISLRQATLARVNLFEVGENKLLNNILLVLFVYVLAQDYSRLRSHRSLKFLYVYFYLFSHVTFVYCKTSLV